MPWPRTRPSSTPQRTLREILPEISAMKGVEQPPEFHPEGDVFQHTRLMLDSLTPNPSVVLAFSVLLHDVGKTADVHARARKTASVSTNTTASAPRWLKSSCADCASRMTMWLRRIVLLLSAST